LADIRPFNALTPPPDLAAAIASVPYDVINSSEARELAAGKPLSFLHVIRPEIDLAEGVDLYSDPVYAKGAENLERWIADVPFEDHGGPVFFIYRLTQAGRSQTGVVAGCSVDEYDSGLIAIHERTRQQKEDDRARHLVEMRCQAEPIFLAYRTDAAISARVDRITAEPPYVDFVAEDGVQHSLWRVADPAALSAAFEAVPRLYVADGHHRTKSASRARVTLSQREGGLRSDASYNRVMAVVFPDNQLDILPYNRVVLDLKGRSAAEVIADLTARFGAAPTSNPTPDRKHCFAVYGDGAWHRFTLAPQGEGVIDGLDVTLLQDQVLQPVFGITDPRTDSGIDFVGGSRGTAELERRADDSSGVAFSLFPTSLAELFAVADAGEIMPPKSTWFEPKLRSGLFIHRI
jgi:uncharacterized protein (DUF1015 family)